MSGAPMCPHGQSVLEPCLLCKLDTLKAQHETEMQRIRHESKMRQLQLLGSALGLWAAIYTQQLLSAAPPAPPTEDTK